MNTVEGKAEYKKPPGAIKGSHPRDFGAGTQKCLSSGLTFCICFATWLILSGRFDRFHISLGVLSCALVAFFSGSLLLPLPFARGLPRKWLAFCAYLPWLFYQIFNANLHMLVLAFHPRMKDHIDPGIIRFNSRLKGDLALLIFANSITLTPGTITVYTSIYGEYTVHAIDGQSAEALPGAMEERVGRIFGE